MKKLVLILMAGIFLVITAVNSSAEDTLNFGMIGSPKKVLKRYKPLTDYLSKKLNVKSRAMAFKSPEALAKKIESGEVQFFFDSPFPALKVCKMSGSKFALRHWKKGVAEYNSVIFSLKGNASSLKDLKGRMVAFEDPDSTSSYLLPKILFLKEGIKLTEKKSLKDSVSSDEVGYVFSKNDKNTLLWLKKKLIYGTGMKKTEIEGSPDYDILSESDMIPRSVVAIAPSVKGALRDSLLAALKGMDQDSAAKEILKTADKTKKFDEFPEGIEVTMEKMDALVELIGY